MLKRNQWRFGVVSSGWVPSLRLPECLKHFPQVPLCFVLSAYYTPCNSSLPGDRGWQVRSGCKIKPGVQLTLHRLLWAILPRVPPRSCLLRFDCVEGSLWDEWGHKLGILRVAYLLVPVFSPLYFYEMPGRPCATRVRLRLVPAAQAGDRWSGRQCQSRRQAR